MAADYRKMYMTVVGPIDRVVTLLEKGGSREEAIRLLVDALQAAEEVYLEDGEQDPQQEA